MPAKTPDRGRMLPLPPSYRIKLETIKHIATPGDFALQAACTLTAAVSENSK